MEVTPDTYVEFIDNEGPHTPVVLHLYSKVWHTCAVCDGALLTHKGEEEYEDMD